MAGLEFDIVYPDVSIPRAQVRNLLDQPAEEFLKDETIDAVIKRGYNIVFSQSAISVSNLNQVKDLIEAIAVWHSYGAYVNTMGESLDGNMGDNYKGKLMHYKEIAVGLGNIFGIDISGQMIDIRENLVIGGTGLSVYNDTDYYQGAAYYEESID